MSWISLSALRRLAAGAALLACLQPAWSAEQQAATLENLVLARGTLAECSVGFRTFGTLAPDKSNAILFPTWLTGRTADLEPLIGPGKIVDSSRYFVIAVDALGDGVSCSPSNSATHPRLAFPEFTIADMVRSQHRLLTEKLGVTHLHAAVGISMGGLQALQWAMLYPDFVGKVVGIVASPQPASQDLLTWNAELRSIEESAQWQNGNYPEGTPFKTLAAIQALSVWTPGYRAEHTSRAGYAAFAQANDDANLKTFSAVDWYRQLQALIQFDLAPDLPVASLGPRVKPKLLLVTSRQDHMMNPGPATLLAKAAKAKILALDSNCGHIAPVCEMGKVGAAVQAFLK